jgi:O-antigen ligase
MGLLTETKTRLLTVTEEENPRLYIWKAALNAFFSHPLLGIGIGSFKSVAYQYSSEMIIYQETHNVFLDILAGTGLLGFIFWLLSIFYILIAGIRNIKIYKQSSYEYILSIATLASFVVMLLHGFTLNISTVRHFWLIAIIILILNEFNLKKEKTD